MNFLDRAKAKATELAGTVKDKVDDFKDGRKVDELLADLGRITYRQRTTSTDPGDAAAIASLVSTLRELEAAGATITRPDPRATAGIPAATQEAPTAARWDEAPAAQGAPTAAKREAAQGAPTAASTDTIDSPAVSIATDAGIVVTEGQIEGAPMPPPSLPPPTI